MLAEEYLNVNGVRLRLLTKGPHDAPVIMLLHDGAWGASADSSWCRMLAHVGNDFRVVAPDLPGFGGSAKVVYLDESPYAFRLRYLFSLLDVLAIDRPVHLVGTSFGGSVALRALSNKQWRPRVASVTTISGTGGPWRSQWGMSQLATYEGSMQDMERIVRLLTDEFDDFDAYVTERHRWAGVVGHYESMVAPHAKPPAGMTRSRPQDDYPATLSDVDVPVLLIGGNRDQLVEPDWMSHLTNAVPTAKTLIFDAKHSPNLSHPQQTWTAMAGFISAA